MSASHSATCQKVLTVKLSPHDVKGVNHKTNLYEQKQNKNHFLAVMSKRLLSPILVSVKYTHVLHKSNRLHSFRQIFSHRKFTMV